MPDELAEEAADDEDTDEVSKAAGVSSLGCSR